jgi:hypothetical protein
MDNSSTHKTKLIQDWFAKRSRWHRDALLRWMEPLSMTRTTGLAFWFGGVAVVEPPEQRDEIGAAA